MRLFALLVTAFALAASLPVHAQAPAAGRGAPPPTAQASAAVDLTGYWVSVVVEDWKWRMVTPKKGVFEGIPLNPEGRKVGEAWDPARDEAAGEQCKAYSAASIMRLPGRVHITWQDASTLKVETDAGTQTRLFQFGAAPPAAAPSVQGRSLATWQQAPGRGRGPRPGGSLKAITTNLKPGYLRKNGAPHSASAVVTEYFTVNTLPNGDQWMTITTKVEDPQYLVRHYLTTTDFLKLPNATGWAPSPCSAR